MNDVALREYVDALFREKEKQVDVIAKALDDRLALLNEFREQSVDEQRRFVTAAEYDAQHSRLVEDVKLLQAQAIRNSGDYVKRSEFEALGLRVSESTGARGIMVAGAAFVGAIILAVTGWTISTVSKNSDTLDKLQKQQFVQDSKIQQIQVLNKFFCETRVQAHLPSC